MQHLEQLACDLDQAGQDLLSQSRFFSALSEGNLEVPAIRNVLKSYAPFRDSFHTLWGHIIARSPSAADPIAMEIVLSLCGTSKRNSATTTQACTDSSSAMWA